MLRWVSRVEGLDPGLNPKHLPPREAWEDGLAPARQMLDKEHVKIREGAEVQAVTLPSAKPKQKFRQLPLEWARFQILSPFNWQRS